MEEHSSSINLYFSNILEERDALQEALNSSFVQHDHTKDQLETLRAAFDKKMAEISFKKVQVDEYNFRINQKFLQLRGEIDNKEKLIEELKLQLECESRESSDPKNFIYINEKETEENEGDGFAIKMGETAALFKKDPRVGLKMGADYKRWVKKLYRII